MKRQALGALALVAAFAAAAFAAVFVTRGLAAVVYVLPSEPDAARFADRHWDPRYELIERRANVVVLAEEQEPALEVALAALE